MADQVDLRIPVSPVHGQVETAGDGSHGPFVQLLNPSDSGVDLFVYELRLGADIASGTSNIRARRTDTPMTLGGTVVDALANFAVEHRDERNTDTIHGELKGCTAVAGTLFGEDESAWFDRVPAAGSAGVEAYSAELFKPECFPWIIQPGSAIEIANPDADAGNVLRVFGVWDEKVVVVP